MPLRIGQNSNVCALGNMAVARATQKDSTFGSDRMRQGLNDTIAKLMQEIAAPLLRAGGYVAFFMTAARVSRKTCAGMRTSRPSFTTTRSVSVRIAVSRASSAARRIAATEARRSGFFASEMSFVVTGFLPTPAGSGSRLGCCIWPKRLPAVCTRFRSCRSPQQSGGSRLQGSRARLAARAPRRER